MSGYDKNISITFVELPEPGFSAYDSRPLGGSSDNLMTLVFEVGSFSTLVVLALFTRLPAALRAFSRAARTDPGILVPSVGEDSRRVAVLWGRMS